MPVYENKTMVIDVKDDKGRPTGAKIKQRVMIPKDKTASEELKERLGPGEKNQYVVLSSTITNYNENGQEIIKDKFNGVK